MPSAGGGDVPLVTRNVGLVLVIVVVAVVVVVVVVDDVISSELLGVVGVGEGEEACPLVVVVFVGGGESALTTVSSFTGEGGGDISSTAGTNHT